MIALVKNMDRGQRRSIEYLKIEVNILKRGMKYSPHLERWLEDMDSEIPTILKRLDKRMKHIDISTGTEGRGIGLRINYLAEFK